jgi:hypothetical protein
MVALQKRVPARMTVDEVLVWDADDLTGRRWQLMGVHTPEVYGLGTPTFPAASEDFCGQ